MGGVGGGGGGDDAWVHRIDAMLHMVQLNLRKMLWDTHTSPLHMVVEKMSTEGGTRFEDGTRLPLGQTLNLQARGDGRRGVKRGPRFLVLFFLVFFFVI
jgi:hypothetical protein